VRLILIPPTMHIIDFRRIAILFKLKKEGNNKILEETKFSMCDILWEKFEFIQEWIERKFKKDREELLQWQF